MMRTIECFLFGLILFFCTTLALGQNIPIDSILALLKNDKEDTNKVNRLNDLAWELKSSNPDTAIVIGSHSLQLAEKLSWKKGIANSLGHLGVYYRLKSNYPKALDYYFQALKIDEVLNNKEGIAKRLGNIGLVYFNQSDYPKALDYYFKALKIAEELGNKNLISSWLGNIGLVYDDQGDFPKALDYYFKAIKIEEGMANKNGIAIWLGNIGGVYHQQADYPKALDYYLEALKLREELGAKNLIATTLGNIGIVYYEQAKELKRMMDDGRMKGEKTSHDIHLSLLYQKALDYYLNALKIAEELGGKQTIAINFSSIGSLYADTKKYEEAEKCLLKALIIDKETGAQNNERQVEEKLSDLYTKTNRHQLALEHYKRAMELKDTLFSEEKNKELTRKEMNYAFEKKEAVTKADQEKKDAVTKIIIYSVSAGFVLVLFLSIFIFRGYKQKQKANIIIREQKELVEEKQKDIMDSIHYARRIQKSLLPTEKYIERKLNELNKLNG